MRQKSTVDRKYTNQELCFDPLHSLILGYFLLPQFLIDQFLFQVTLLEQLSFVQVNPERQEHMKRMQITLI